MPRPSIARRFAGGNPGMNAMVPFLRMPSGTVTMTEVASNVSPTAVVRTTPGPL